MKQNHFSLLAAAFAAAAFFVCVFAYGSAHTLAVYTQADGVQVPVLMYHHMLKESKLLGSYCITPQEFREDLEYIRSQGYTPVTARELVEYCDKGAPLPEKPILITFDDGYESTYVYAYPILKELGMKACVSVIGYYSDLYTNVPDSHINYSHLTWSQITEMYNTGVFEIGNHTYNLHSLDNGRKGCKINKNENVESYKHMLTEDLTKVQERITENLGVTPLVFAYPFGSTCKEAQEVVEQLGFPIILTCEEGMNIITSKADLKSMKRYNRAHNVNREQFFQKVFAGQKLGS